MMEKIPVMKPKLPAAASIYSYWESIDTTRHYSNFGPLNNDLTQRLASYFQVDYENVLLVTNGTLALQAAVATASAPRSRWVIPSWTFIATAQAVSSAGSVLELEDVDEISWSLKESKTRICDGVISVAPFGGKVELESWAEESRSHPVVVDAASCFDSCRDLSLVNKYNISVMVSLHATKLVTTGEGGVIVGPKAWIFEMKRWINFGFFGDRIARRTGTNAKMSEYQAAIGLASLDEWNATREEWSSRIKKLSEGLLERGIRVQPAIADGFVTSTLVALVENSARKIEIEKRLAAEEIDSRDWWGAGVHNMPAFSDISETFSTNLSVTENLASRTLGLPLFVDLTDMQISRILMSVSE
jgi:dTDP-4-amino-4,6-dideoxygalactose transaminase